MEPLSELILTTLIEVKGISYDKKKEILTALKISDSPIVTVNDRQRIVEFLHELDLNMIQNKK